MRWFSETTHIAFEGSRLRFEDGEPSPSTSVVTGYLNVVRYFRLKGEVSQWLRSLYVHMASYVSTAPRVRGAGRLSAL